MLFCRPLSSPPRARARIRRWGRAEKAARVGPRRKLGFPPPQSPRPRLGLSALWGPRLRAGLPTTQAQDPQPRLGLLASVSPLASTRKGPQKDLGLPCRAITDALTTACRGPHTQGLPSQQVQGEQTSPEDKPAMNPRTLPGLSSAPFLRLAAATRAGPQHHLGLPTRTSSN